MGRPKLYTDRAEKMRAYRARRSDRKIEVDRPSLESLQERLGRMRAAVRQAQDAGSKEAGRIDTITLEDTIEGITDLFERLAAALVARKAEEAEKQVVSGAVVAPVKQVPDRVAAAVKRNVTIPAPEQPKKYDLPKKGRQKAR